MNPLNIENPMEGEDTSSVLTLVSLVHSSSASWLEKKLIEIGLSDFSTSHGNILRCLASEGKMTMGQLAKKVNRDKSTLTVLVRQLEKEGYIERENSVDDARVSFICLTDKGKTYTDQTMNISKELIKTCFKGFTTQEKELLIWYLNRIYENFS